MILIFSQEFYETTTDDILQWLEYMNVKALRINGEDIIDRISVNIDTEFPQSQTVQIGQNKIDIEKVKVIFFRRYILFRDKIKILKGNKTAEISGNVERHLLNEYFKIYNYVEGIFPSAIKISSVQQERNLNKLMILESAKKIGFKIPSTLVTNQKHELERFLMHKKDCIIKPIHECQYYFDKNIEYKMLSIRLTGLDLKMLPDKFFPSCIQENIEKRFEIRVYFLNGKCYSMAIFSQQNTKTSVDFRNYDNVKPNRTVSYKLPLEIENKIISLMKELKLKTGSIDLIKSKNNQYFFLEVNPNGQFGMVSYPCNFLLEKKLANFLIQEGA